MGKLLWSWETQTDLIGDVANQADTFIFQIISDLLVKFGVITTTRSSTLFLIYLTETML